ncbi:MAG TPA: neutral zinc metallopeptidase [Xanthobacteraceae bacterium]|nr:neutral zinc metallopeptidase [Xanthobacteraceae bacterium]
MRWDQLPKSDDIEDRRDDDEGGGLGGGFGQGGFNLPVHGGLGIGTIVVLGLIGYALGINPNILIGGAEILSGGGNPSGYNAPIRQTSHQTGTPTDQMGQFVAAILGSANDQWSQILSQRGVTYQRPRLVLFRNRTQSACGAAQSAMGPFYCPNDREVYLDTSFFNDLQRRFHGCEGKACEFAQAYVIAHEVGHHVQNLLGTLTKTNQAQRAAASKADANRIQVRIELQADCFAGVWANHSEQKWKFLDPGDVDAALQTASAIGDDRLQRAATGTVVPDSFTHGSSEQRKRWFTNGLKAGTIEACDTFNAAQL